MPEWPSYNTNTTVPFSYHDGPRWPTHIPVFHHDNNNLMFHSLLTSQWFFHLFIMRNYNKLQIQISNTGMFTVPYPGFPGSRSSLVVSSDETKIFSLSIDMRACVCVCVCVRVCVCMCACACMIVIKCVIFVLNLNYLDQRYNVQRKHRKSSFLCRQSNCLTNSTNFSASESNCEPHGVFPVVYY